MHGPTPHPWDLDMPLSEPLTLGFLPLTVCVWVSQMAPKKALRGGAFDAMPARIKTEEKEEDFRALMAANPGIFLDPEENEYKTALYLKCNACSTVMNSVQPHQALHFAAEHQCP